jgi:hypothetical protein
MASGAEVYHENRSAKDGPNIGREDEDHGEANSVTSDKRVRVKSVRDCVSSFVSGFRVFKRLKGGGGSVGFGSAPSSSFPGPRGLLDACLSPCVSPRPPGGGW